MTGKWENVQMSCSSQHTLRNQLTIRIILLPLFLVATHSVAQETDYRGKSDPSVRGNAQKGKRLYDSYGCYQCHGGQGQGSILTGPRIGPDPTGFSGFVRYIRQPAGEMPPYSSKVVTDAELADIFAFLAALPQPQDAKRIPLLNPEKKR
jgi:mono/diheme cytochrome c family protein